MLAAGTTVTRVARLFGCCRATIHNLGRRYNQTGDTADAPRSGRPKATTPRQDRMITLTHLCNRFQPATVTARQFHVSGQTIRNRLRSNRRKIRARRPYRGPILPRRHRDARLQWSRRHLKWTGTIFYSEMKRDSIYLVQMDEFMFTGAQVKGTRIVV